MDVQTRPDYVTQAFRDFDTIQERIKAIKAKGQLATAEDLYWLIAALDIAVHDMRGYAVADRGWVRAAAGLSVIAEGAANDPR